MVLKQIITRNIQNHKEVVVDLPPSGLIVFTGDNSNGKSVIVKITKAILNGDIRKPKKRASLVNRNSTFGEAIYTRDDDVKLTLHLTREAATTYISYTAPGEEPITRYLSDKSYEDLVERFGWHYAKNSDISIQIAEADEALLFYKTKYTVNGDIIHTATTDSAANKAVENMQQTIKDARSFKDDSVTKVRVMQASIADLKIFDIEELTAKRDKLTKLYKTLSTIYFPTIPEIKPVPKVKFVSVHQPTIPSIKYPKIVKVDCNIPDIIPVAMELKDLRNRKCPTCGRGFDCGC